MGKNCYLADNATIIGDVVMGDDCFIWFGAVLRGDVNPIRMGKDYVKYAEWYKEG